MTQVPLFFHYTKLSKKTLTLNAFCFWNKIHCSSCEPMMLFRRKFLLSHQPKSPTLLLMFDSISISAISWNPKLRLALLSWVRTVPRAFSCWLATCRLPASLHWGTRFWKLKNNTFVEGQVTVWKRTSQRWRDPGVEDMRDRNIPKSLCASWESKQCRFIVRFTAISTRSCGLLVGLWDFAANMLSVYCRFTSTQ